MTRVDFYVLDNPARGGAPGLACRLAEKAYNKGHRIYVHVQGAEQAEALDALLWTFKAGSFVPHALAGKQKDEAPVHIGFEEDPVETHNDVLINLTAQVPLFFSRFARVVELVDADEAARTRARERFRFYRERGYTLDTHNIAG